MMDTRKPIKERRASENVIGFIPRTKSAIENEIRLMEILERDNGKILRNWGILMWWIDTTTHFLCFSMVYHAFDMLLAGIHDIGLETLLKN